MKTTLKIFLLTLSLFASTAAFSQVVDSIPKRYQHEVVLHSSFLGEDRTVWVHVPSEYNESTDRYPVLYLLDGGSHFTYTTGMVDYLSGFEANDLPRMIIVGIPNVDRGRDFTPVLSPAGNGSKNKNGAAAFAGFIQHELVPYIDKTYRTQPFRILEAHSFAGLFAIYAQPLQPEVFQASVIISPALGSEGDPLKVMNNYQSFLQKNTGLNHRMFITLGDESTKGVDLLTRQLKAYAPKSFRWQFKKYEGENHFSVPLKSIYDGLRFIYASWHMEIFLNRRAIPYAEVEAHFQTLSQQFGYTITPTEDFLNQCGYQQLRANHLPEAMQFFQQNIKLHPNSFNVYDSMGEAYMLSGQKDLAIEYYQKSIVLNPNNENGKEMLKKLREK